MDEGDDSPAGFFTKRAKLAPQKSAEELQAAAELMAKIQEEMAAEAPVKSVKKSLSPKSRPKKNPARSNRKKLQTSPQKDREDDIEDDSFIEVSLSIASKKRLKRLKDEQLQELERIEAENQKIFSLDVNLNYPGETVKETTEDFQKISVLTIMYMSKVSRLKCFENDKFVDIFPKIAELFNLRVTEFLLCLETKNITVDDTPGSLGITDKDILECIPYKSDEKSKPDVEDIGNTFKIIFQSNDAKAKIELVIHKMEKMQEIMKRYSEQRNIPLDRLLFSFDGEKISGDETPVELDMETESCVDVTVLENAEPDIESESCDDVTVLEDKEPDIDTESCDDVTVLDDKEPDIDTESCDDVTILASPSKVRKNAGGRGRGRGRRRKGNKKNSLVSGCVTL